MFYNLLQQVNLVLVVANTRGYFQLNVFELIKFISVLFIELSFRLRITGHELAFKIPRINEGRTHKMQDLRGLFVLYSYNYLTQLFVSSLLVIVKQVLLYMDQKQEIIFRITQLLLKTLVCSTSKTPNKK